MIGKMSLSEELGQLFVAELTGTDMNANNIAMISQLHAGGIILYAFSMQTAHTDPGAYPLLAGERQDSADCIR